MRKKILNKECEEFEENLYREMITLNDEKEKLLSNFDTDEFSLKIKNYKTVKNIYRVILKQNIKFPIEYSELALEKIKMIEENNLSYLPICGAKTQYSLSDDAKNLECKEPFKITIRDINLKAGAGFVVAIAGKIMTMPGLPRVPAAEVIDIDENGEVVGIF